MSTAAVVRERQILFSGRMVRAILDGRKTVTRRVVKPQPFPVVDSAVQWPDGFWTWRTMGGLEPVALRGFACPYGQPGDRLWVRETWVDDRKGLAKYRADYDEREIVPGVENTAADDGDLPAWAIRWRPSIHMPRWASRITLEVTNVRVERLQEITEEGAQAEGRTLQDFGSGGPGYFPHTWDELNAMRGHGWATNPWVWVIAFRRLP